MAGREGREREGREGEEEGEWEVTEGGRKGRERGGSRSVQFSGITSPIRPPTLRNIMSSNVEL